MELPEIPKGYSLRRLGTTVEDTDMFLLHGSWIPVNLNENGVQFKRTSIREAGKARFVDGTKITFIYKEF